MPSRKIDIKKIHKAQRAFSKAREWDKFHTPKNIAAALSVEASELLEIFTWLSEKESRSVMKNPKIRQAVRHEMADVFYYLCRLADLLDVDLEESFWEKMGHNAAKYPVLLSRGSARKYTEYRLNKT